MFHIWFVTFLLNSWHSQSLQELLNVSIHPSDVFRSLNNCTGIWVQACYILFPLQMGGFMSMNGGQTKLYSANVIKLNRSMKPQPRVYVLTETHLYRLDQKYSSTKKGALELNKISSVEVSKGSDSAIVIHTTVSTPAVYCLFWHVLCCKIISRSILLTWSFCCNSQTWKVMKYFTLTTDVRQQSLWLLCTWHTPGNTNVV